MKEEEKFAGQDTVKYKEIGLKIKELKDESQEVPDEIKCKLFIERLKLAFPLKSHEDKKSEVIANLQREQEIL